MNITQSGFQAWILENSQIFPANSRRED
jgi:hypothetical protein